MDDLLETATRCPHCRASVRPGAPWCTLCHADLRPPPPPPADPPAVLRPDPLTDPLPDPLTVPAQDHVVPEAVPVAGAGDPTWPCTTCGASNRLTDDACVACGAGFLAGLRESEGPLLELPGIGDLTRIGRGQRLLIAIGVVLAVIAFVALLGLLFS